jgi:hypothetical protein
MHWEAAIARETPGVAVVLLAMLRALAGVLTWKPLFEPLSWPTARQLALWVPSAVDGLPVAERALDLAVVALGPSPSTNATVHDARRLLRWCRSAERRVVQHAARDAGYVERKVIRGVEAEAARRTCPEGHHRAVDLEGWRDVLADVMRLHPELAPDVLAWAFSAVVPDENGAPWHGLRSPSFLFTLAGWNAGGPK